MTRPAPARLRGITIVLILLGMLVTIAQPWSAPAGRAQDGGSIGSAPVYDGDEPQVSDEGIVVAAGIGLTVNTANRSDVVTFFNNQYVNAPRPASGWNGNVASCNAGTTTDAYKAAVLKRINFYRAMAGVPSDTTISAAKSAKNQQGALMMSAEGSLSHSPGTSWACYSANGAQAAASSNIAIGMVGWDAIDGYMKDKGSGNTTAGHRRWILLPQVQSFGTGDVTTNWVGSSPANTLWVFEENSILFGPRPSTRDTFVAWPPQGYVPYQVVFPRWSFSYPGANFSNASVTMKQGSSSVSIVTESRGSGSGVPEASIVWRPSNLADSGTWAKPDKDTPYTITIKNVVIGGTAREFNYTVTVIDPAGPASPTPTATKFSAPTPTCSTSPTSGTVRTVLTMTCSKFLPGETVTAHWDNTTTKPLTSVTADSSGRAKLSFRIPSTTKGVHKAVAKGNTGGRTARNDITVNPSLSLDPASGAVGTAVTGTLRGFARSEVVTVTFYLTSSSTTTVATNVTTSSTGTAEFEFTVPTVSTGNRKVRAAGNAGSVAEATFKVAAAAQSIGQPTRTATATRTAVPPTATSTATSPPQPTATSTPPPLPTETPAPTETPTSEPTIGSAEGEPPTENEPPPG